MTAAIDPAAGRMRRATARRILLLVSVIVLFLLAYLAAKPVTFFFEPNRYASNISIERAPAYRDGALLKRAWRLPVAAAYARQPYEFQHNQSFCGPTSIADVLHSLGDHRPQERILAGTSYHTVFGYLPGGLTLDQEADVLRRTSDGAVEVRRGLSLVQFRAEMRATNDPGRRYIVNFHRGPLFGRGHGHFSPLLGYLEQQDLVLVGDVNPNYRPFLAATSRLWAATETIDAATGKRRGLVILTLPDHRRAGASPSSPSRDAPRPAGHVGG